MITIQQSLKTSTKKLKQKNISSADLDAEVLLLAVLNKSKIHNYNNINDIDHEISACRTNRTTSLCETSRNDSKKLDRSWLYINNDYILNRKEEKIFNNFIDQKLKHKPLAYIINRKEFYGYDFYVDENVLIPRPETEIIVEEVLKILNKKSNFKNKFNLVDIGTGSGCILISVLNELVKNKKDKLVHNVFANDISAKAITVAKINTKKYNLNEKIKFTKDDLKKFLNKENIFNSNEIIITANLPYIKNDDHKNLSVNVKKYEPKIALAAGEDGLVYIEKLIGTISKIRKKYEQKIYIFIEADPDQMSKITFIINKKLANINTKIVKDLSGKKRIVFLHC